MFAFSFSSGKKQLAAFVPPLSLCVYFTVFTHSEEVTIWGVVHALCVIHKGVSYVLMVQMIVSVNLNKSAYLKYFLDIFFMLTAHRWTPSFLWLFCSSNTVHTVFLLRPQLYISTFLFFFFLKTTLWPIVWFIHGFFVCWCWFVGISSYWSLFFSNRGNQKLLL